MAGMSQTSCRSVAQAAKTGCLQASGKCSEIVSIAIETVLYGIAEPTEHTASGGKDGLFAQSGMIDAPQPQPNH
jgi:hypothetical protein